MHLGEVALPSYLDFYRTTFSASIGEVRSVGEFATSLFNIIQGPGDWSDAASSDLVFTLLTCKSIRIRANLGAGYLPHIMRGRTFVVTPVGTPSEILIDDPHRAISLGVPYRKVLAMFGHADLPTDGDFGRIHTCFQDDPIAVSLLERIWLEGATGSVGGALLADGLVLQLLACLLRNSGRLKGAARGGLTPRQIMMCREAINEQLDARLSLTDLAKLVGLSPYHFCRAFKQSVGVPPHTYQQKIRVLRACELLKTDAPITKIALDVGYGSGQAFARAFRKQMGRTPLDYRRSYR